MWRFGWLSRAQPACRSALCCPSSLGGSNVVSSKCSQSVCRHCSLNRPLPAIFPSRVLPGCRHSPMRLFSSFTSSCLRISPIRGHTYITSTEKRVRSGNGKRKQQGLWWKLRLYWISFHMELWQEWLSFLVLSANCMLGAIYSTSMF